MNSWCFIAYSLNDTLHLGHPVGIVEECRIFQKSLLESLSSDSNLGQIQLVKTSHFWVNTLDSRCFLHLQNISSSSSKVGAGPGHKRSGQNGGSIIDVESAGSSTNHQGTWKSLMLDDTTENNRNMRLTLTKWDIWLTVIVVHMESFAKTHAQSVKPWAQDFDSDVASCSTAMKT